MDWFERYLQAVRKHLPFERQADIIAELRANLEAQLEDRQESLGRPLTEGEMLDWLKTLGPPMRMAARYQPARYLIGPNLFPMYWQILRLVMIWATVGYAIATVVRTVVEQHSGDWLAQTLGGYPGILFTSAAWVTAVFAALEYFAERHPEKCPPFFAASPNWSPTTLAPLEKEPTLEGKPRTLVAAIAEFVANFVLLVWLILIPRYPFLILGPGAAFLHHTPLLFTPIVVLFYWCAVTVHACQWGWQGYNLLAENWRIKPYWHRFVSKGLGVLPIAILLAAPGHIYVTGNPDSTAALPDGFQIAAVNHWVFVSCAVLALLMVIDFAKDLWKASSASRHHQFRTVL